jgi:hypothetical protein
VTVFLVLVTVLLGIGCVCRLIVIGVIVGKGKVSHPKKHKNMLTNIILAYSVILFISSDPRKTFVMSYE